MTLPSGNPRTLELTEVNKRVACDPAQLVSEVEAAFDARVAELASLIVRDKPCAVAVAGPSGSGKTTFSHKLIQRLQGMNCRGHLISLDCFFRNRSELISAEGTYDFESPQALDLAYMTDFFEALLAGRQAVLPCFDFESGTRLPNGSALRKKEGDVFLIEGLHALNPLVTRYFPPRLLKTVAIATSSVFTLQGVPFLEPASQRLIRRMSRDHIYRGARVDFTLALWDSVCQGEAAYIAPYRDSAEFTVDTTLAYEPCVLRQKALSLLQAALPESSRPEALRSCIAWLTPFADLDERLVPADSLLREFIRGSRYYPDTDQASAPDVDAFPDF